LEKNGTTKWHKLTQVGVRGTTGTRSSGSSYLHSTSGTRRNGFSDRQQVEQGQWVCPDETLHLFQSGSTRPWNFLLYLKGKAFKGVDLESPLLVIVSLTQLNSTQFNSTQLNSTQLNPRAPLFNNPQLADDSSNLVPSS